VILEYKPLLIPIIISSGSGITNDNEYQQQYICNGSKIITDGSFEPLKNRTINHFGGQNRSVG
jgi:hypothetical protein